MIPLMINGRVLVKPDSPKKVTEGGIELPDISKDVPKSGIVISSDYSYKDKDGAEYFFKEGSRVHFHSFCPLIINLKLTEKEEEFYIIKCEDILFVEGTP